MNTDLRFLSDYYKDLFEYLNVNMLLLKARNNVAKESMKTEDNTILSVMNSSFEKRIEYSINYNKIVKQEYKKLKKESKNKSKFISNNFSKLYYMYVYLKIHIKKFF